MKSGCQSCALAAESSHALGISRRKITHTSTSIWAMPARSFAPTALRYSVSIRPWVHTKLIRQIVLTLARSELKSGNAASLVVLPADDHRNFRADFLRTARKLGLIGLRSLGYWSKRAAKPGATIAAGTAELCVAHDESSRRRLERLKRANSGHPPTTWRAGQIGRVEARGGGIHSSVLIQVNVVTLMNLLRNYRVWLIQVLGQCQNDKDWGTGDDTGERAGTQVLANRAR